MARRFGSIKGAKEEREKKVTNVMHNVSATAKVEYKKYG